VVNSSVYAGPLLDGKMNPEQKETLKILMATVRAIQDREIDAEEAVILCKLAGDLLERIAPLVNEHRLSWVIRAGIYGARSALMETSSYFDRMTNEAPNGSQ